MANEIRIAASLDASKNGTGVGRSHSKQLTMSGEDVYQATQLIGTSAETIAFGEISGAPSAVLIKNLDSTNFVEIGGDSGLTVFKLKILAGSVQLITPSSGTLYAKADTAAVRIEVTAVEA